MVYLAPPCSSRFICMRMWDHSVCQQPLCHESSLPRLPVSTPPTGLDECFFFNSLVDGLPYSLTFCQFWLFFVFKFVIVLLLVVQGGTVCLPTPPSWPEGSNAICIKPLSVHYFLFIFFQFIISHHCCC